MAAVKDSTSIETVQRLLGEAMRRGVVSQTAVRRLNEALETARFDRCGADHEAAPAAIQARVKRRLQHEVLDAVVATAERFPDDLVVPLARKVLRSLEFRRANHELELLLSFWEPGNVRVVEVQANQRKRRPVCYHHRLVGFSHLGEVATTAASSRMTRGPGVPGRGTPP